MPWIATLSCPLLNLCACAINAKATPDIGTFQPMDTDTTVWTNSQEEKEADLEKRLTFLAPSLTQQRPYKVQKPNYMYL